MTAVRFWFDVISPFAYLAWQRIGELAARHGREVEPAPVLFAALLDHHGQLGPAEVPAKRTYIFKHAVRLADSYGVPFAPPPAHPFNPLLALRVVGLEMSADDRRRAAGAVLGAAWGGGPGVVDPAAVAGALTEAGLPGAELVERARQPEAKASLRATTDEALARGVFGVPTVDIDGELFWGCDALPHADAHLAGRDPVTPALLERWRDLPAQARRPGARRDR